MSSIIMTQNPKIHRLLIKGAPEKIIN